MKKEKTKVYTYKRVSTTMQIDGYSLDAQRARMKAYADFNDYEIVGEYEDAGKSGKSIEGRWQFNQMMEDVKSGKDNVSYVLVFKLSRFGRNAADVLSTLQVMQDFGVNLICVECRATHCRIHEQQIKISVFKGKTDILPSPIEECHKEVEVARINKLLRSPCYFCIFMDKYRQAIKDYYATVPINLMFCALIICI